MRKKLFALLLAVLLVASALPMAASAASGGDCSENGDGSVTWSVENGTLIISGSGKMKQYQPGPALGGEEAVGEYTAPWYSYHPTKALIKADVTDTGMSTYGGLFWDCEALESFEVEAGNSVYYAYDGCLYANQPEYTYGEYDPDTGNQPMIPTGKVQQVLLAIPPAKKGPLVIKEGTATGVTYSSFGLIGPCKYLTGIEFPSSWWKEGMGFDSAGNESVFDDGKVKNYTLSNSSPIQYYKIGENHPNTKSIDGCLYTKDGTRLVWAPPMPVNGEIKVAEGTKTLSLSFDLGKREQFTKEALKIILPRSVTADEGFHDFASFSVPVEVHGYKGSYAETFASQAHAKFVPLNENPTVGGFTDVFEGDYYAKSVKWAVENNITNGTSNTTFSPGKDCTRGQIVTFLWNAAGKPEPKSTTNPFVDVKPGDYYYKAVLWAVENQITNGLSATSFGPGRSCTRNQAVTFLWNAEGKPSVSGGSTFGDVEKGSYYEEAVKWAVANKVTNGTSPTTFGPKKVCTRGQIVTFLYNAQN